MLFYYKVPQRALKGTLCVGGAVSKISVKLAFSVILYAPPADVIQARRYDFKFGEARPSKVGEARV